MSKRYFSVANLSKDDIDNLGIKDVYNEHQTIWKCFPNRDGVNADFVFDFREIGDTIKITMNSKEKPSDYNEIKWRSVERTADDYQPGEYVFSITVNPVIRKNGTKKMVPITDPEAACDWLARKLSSQYGCDVNTITIMRSDSIPVKKPNGQTWFFNRMEFCGELTVNDSDKFFHFMDGIGRQKRMNCGFMKVLKKSC